MKDIIWTPKKVKVASLKANPLNPKITTEIGIKRLNTSLSKYGLAGTIPVNLDMMIIDGHKRKDELLDQKVEEVWVSVPNRMLTEKEYKEMNALFDLAKAGEPDIFMIENLVSEDVIDEFQIGKEGKMKKAGGKAGDEYSSGAEPKYPLVPQYDERHEAIIIICSNVIDTTFIKNALGITQAMSYKNKNVKETSIVPAKQFIDKWTESKSKSSSRQRAGQKQS